MCGWLKEAVRSSCWPQGPHLQGRRRCLSEPATLSGPETTSGPAFTVFGQGYLLGCRPAWLTNLRQIPSCSRWAVRSPHTDVPSTSGPGLTLSCPPGLSWFPAPPHKGHVMEKLVVGRGQEVSGWGPGEGQQIKAGVWSRGGQAQGQRSDTALRSAEGTSPPQPGKWTAPRSSPVSRAKFIHSFILCSSAWSLQQAWPCSSADRQGGRDALLSGQLFPDEK